MAEELNLGGYLMDRNLLAQKYIRGSQNIYLIALPLNLVNIYLPKPDPNEPFEGNRRVNLSRAIKFGEYWRGQSDWVAPPLLLDTNFMLSGSFESLYKVKLVELGVLKLPSDSNRQLNILDGQHRILGIISAQQKLYEEQRLYEEQLNNFDSEVTREKLANVMKLIDRLNTECITIEIIEGINVQTHKQFFHDIAVNAKGINKAVVAGFDQRLIANRVAVTISEEHSLLAGNTEYEADRVSGSNLNLISRKSVADIVNEIVCGITKKLTPQQQRQMSDKNLGDIVHSFFDLLIASFEEYDKVAAGELSPAELRDSSMLGSTTMIRHFANLFGVIALEKSDLGNLRTTVPGVEKCRKLLVEFSKNMDLPVNQKWMATGFFPKDAKAPGSRTQELKGLSNLIVEWASSENYWSV